MRCDSCTKDAAAHRSQGCSCGGGCKSCRQTPNARVRPARPARPLRGDTPRDARAEAAPNVPQTALPEHPHAEWLLPGFNIPKPAPGAVVNLLPATIQALTSSRTLIRPAKDALRPRAQGCGSLIRPGRRFKPPRPGGGAVIQPEAQSSRAESDEIADTPDDDNPIGSLDDDGHTEDPSSDGDVPIEQEDEGETIVESIPLGYRTVTFTVDARWLADYVADWAAMYSGYDITATASNGKVSSIKDALDELWPRFRAARKGSHTTFHKLIGCYNLPRRPGWSNEDLSSDLAAAPSWLSRGERLGSTLKPDLFWHLDWGPAHKVLMYALQLIYTYPEFLDNDQLPDECTESGTVDDSRIWKDDGCSYSGLRNFITTALSAKPATSKQCKTCKVVIHLRNADKRFADDASFGYVNKPCAENTLDCVGGYKTCKEVTDTCDANFGNIVTGNNYDRYDLNWVADHRCLSAIGPSDSKCRAPDPGTVSAAFASRNNFTITTHPIVQHFRGSVCDYLLFLARLALDHARDGESDPWAALATQQAASRIARYGLGIIAELSGMLIHEYVHLYLHIDAKKTHCPTTSCTTIASKQFRCKVGAMLGLPWRTLSHREDPTTTDDYDSEDHRHWNPDADDRMDYCDTVAEGVPSQTGYYCSTGCLSDLNSADLRAEFDRLVDCIEGAP